MAYVRLFLILKTYILELDTLMSNSNRLRHSVSSQAAEFSSANLYTLPTSPQKHKQAVCSTVYHAYVVRGRGKIDLDPENVVQ